MASADLRKELDCSICLSIYTDPVMLTCGHNFCRVCIDRVLDTQGKSGGHSCPDCRAEFQQRPALYRNITLCNIVENFRSTQPNEEKVEVSCTHCVDFPVPAVKSCLHCEASLCEKHLNVHSKSPEHVLCDPTASLESRKCSVHKKILEYYCTEDSACICLACRLDGAHNGHQVNMLAVASGIKKENLKTLHQKLITKQKEATRRIHQLQEHKRNVLEKADGEKAQMTALLGNLRILLEDLDKSVLGEISEQTERLSCSFNDLIRELEVKKDELARKMRHIEELCNMEDPLIVLQEPDTGDLCDTEDGDDERHDRLLHDGKLNVTGGLQTLKAGLWEMLSGINKRIEEGDDVWLDENTAGGKLQISNNGKTVTAFPSSDPDLPETPQRFKNSAVWSSQSFSYGRHTWEVDVSGSVRWDVGICYPSVDKGWNGELRYFTNNGQGELQNKYWGIHRQDQYFYSMDGNAAYQIYSQQRIRIYLDYKAGQISFCELSVPIRHIHTFNATFTEPLHLVIGVWDDYGYIKLCERQDQ